MAQRPSTSPFGDQKPKTAVAAIDAGWDKDRLASLRRAAESRPADERLWSRYVFELRSAGLKSRARKAARAGKVTGAARKRLLDIAEGRRAFSDDIAGLIRNGAFAEAWLVGNERLKSFPDDVQLRVLLGAAALAEDDPVRAESVLAPAFDLAPKSVPVRTNLGLALLRQGRAETAVSVLEPIATENGGSIDARVNLASAYVRLERMAEALELTTPLLAEAPEDPDVVGVHGRALIRVGRADEAVELLRGLADNPAFSLHDVLADAIAGAEGLDAAIEYALQPSDTPSETQQRLAALLAEWGELGRAGELARSGADATPHDPAPYRLLGLCGAWSSDDPLINLMQRGARDESLSPVKRGTFSLALAKAYLDTGDDAAAFRALADGNRMLRGVVDYDIAADAGWMDRIAGNWSAETVDRFRQGGRKAAPVFIVGLPRSGSTLVETILSRHAAVHDLGETPAIFTAARRATEAPGPEAISALADAAERIFAPPAGKTLTTNKLLSNFQNLGALAAALPDARFVEMRRDYRDTCLSIFQSDLTPTAHPYSMDLTELAHYALAYDRLMRHWSKVLGDRLVRVRYEDIVTDPEAEIRQLLERLDLDWDPACLEPDKS
ncbi:MAG: tetratricopeptide repeat protein, partial [Silicimonas sp.]|nr:tetratricopeptide repeat protein [Silicimonas sp.]